jgi:Tfp pilus assembly protein PilF
MWRLALVALLLVCAGPAAADATWTRAGWYRIEILPALKLLEGPLAGRKACLKTLGEPKDSVVTCARLTKQGAEVDVALAFFADAIKADPKDAKAMNHRGLLFAQRGQYDRAIDEHTAAIKAAPDDLWAFVFRGTLYQKIGMEKEAEADFRSALALNPADRRLVEKLKATLREMGVEP